MQHLQKFLFKEERRLSSITKATATRLKTAPEGSLRISAYKGRERFYQWAYHEKDKYLRKSEAALIQALAQKSYDEKVFRLASRRLNQIQKILKDYKDDEIDKIYLNECEYRRKLIKPVEPVWQDMVQEWLAIPYQGKPFAEGFPIIETAKGERVRSKSEKILADYFYSKEIPYKYECPLKLPNFGTVYPDFTFLSPKTGREIYWEHDGKMDDVEYATKAIQKIYTYEKNGFYPWVNLILTFETSQSILTTATIENLVNHYLIQT